jgi:ATP-dependent helicase/nuclease subunit A
VIHPLPDPDEAVRRKIHELLDENFLVEAGAGTGKTRALVDRVIALVLGGRRIDRIVAITFTEKAAAELRDRVRVGLEAARDDDGLPPEHRLRVEEALASLDRSHISTIHAFCQALLRQFAPQLGIDPAFEVQDEVLADRRFEEQWRLYLDRLGDDTRAKAAVNRALDLGLRTADIETLAVNLWKHPEIAPLLHRRPLGSPATAWPDLQAHRAALLALPLALVPTEDKLRLAVENLAALIEAVLDAGERREAQLAGVVAGLKNSYSTLGRRDFWAQPQILDAARQTAQDAADVLRTALESLRSEALAPIVGYVVDFVLGDGQARGREGRLVFDDLILRARDLMAIPAAGAAIRERFDCLLIDEFQDTDPLQVEIATAFATDPETGRLEPGRLFLVGDPKQSIYRFRRADMAVYSATRRLMADEDARMPELTHNRRSRSQIIDWVNGVFSGLIGIGDAPDYQPPYRGIRAARDGSLAGPGVAWLGDAVEANARTVRATEAAAVAAQIAAAVREGWSVEERETREVRPAAYRDIAVLLPTRAILTPLEHALQDAEIPYRVEGGSLVYGTQEVRDVINCLTAIDDPADEVAIVAALRSPAYACSDVEIADFRFGGGRFDYTRAGLEQREGRVAGALRSLYAFHQSRQSGSLAALVERFLADRGLVVVGLLDQASRNSYRRARFVVEQARAFEAAGPESLRAFISWLERRARRAVLDNEGAGLDDDEDAVRVLTVHGAKGLEFPIVIAAGLGVGPGSDRRVFGHDRTTEEISVHLGSANRRVEFNLGPVAQITAQETAHLKAERDRLLYVAATRARDHLVVSLFHKQGANESAAARLIANGARDGVEESRPEPVPRTGRYNSIATLEVEDAGPLEGFEEARAALVEGSRKLKVTSATALGPALKKETSDETEPWARGRGGTHIGRAVHAALQIVRWEATDAEVAAVAKAQAVAEAVPDREREVARLVRSALETEAAARARAAQRALREVPFALLLDGVLVEGFADLVIDGPDGLEIVDWKTDDVAAATAANRLREYELQAGLYVLGLEAATGRKVSRLTYVFVRPSLELSPGEPAALASSARRRLQEMAG